MQNNSIEKLLTYQNQGYLFHGSPDGNIKVLEPREAKDINPRKIFNSDKAVFGSSIALVTIIFGVVPEKARRPEQTRDKPWYTKWPNGEVSSGIPLSWKEVVETNTGYVYVLPKDTFTENLGTQYKSKQSVAPIERIEVTLKDFLDLGGKVEWLAS